MSHYEQRLEQDVANIRGQVRALGMQVCEAVRDAARAAVALDVPLATEIVLGDLRINRSYLELDHQCHLFIARHLPSARHLRFVSGVLRVNVILERVGDYAETIARAALQLEEAPPVEVGAPIEEVAARAYETLEAAIDAFDAGDADQARAIRAKSKRRGSTFGKTFEDLNRAGERATRSVPELFAFLAIFSRLERVISQARSICRQTMFVATGEVPEGKSFRFLFVDDHGSASRLAAAYARKAYPTNGSYEAAAWEPQPLRVGFAPLAEEKVMGLGEPASELTRSRSLAEVDLVIDLGTGVRERHEGVPFQTTIVSWQLEEPGDPQRVYEQIVPLLQDLFVVLVGEDPA